jgi:hypothetical protein
VIVVRQIGPKRVFWGIVVWSIIVAACLFTYWTHGHIGVTRGYADTALWIAGALTAAVGFWIGWRRRLGTAFFAPLLAWFVLVPWAFAAGFVQFGFLKGLWHGFLLAVFGGFVAAFCEGVVIVMFGLLGRIANGSFGPKPDEQVVIYPPGTL